MALRRRPSTASPGAVLTQPTRLTAEGTCTCSADPNLVWSLLEDPSSPLHFYGDVVHAGWLEGTGKGVGGVQVTIRHDPVTGSRYALAMEITEHQPGRYAAWRSLPASPEMAVAPSGGTARLQQWPDGSVTVTHTSWVELPVGYPQAAAREVQSNLDAHMEALTARCYEVLNRY